MLHNEPEVPNRRFYLAYMQAMWRRFFGLNVSQIEPLLFVGGEFRAQQWPLLYKLGIRAVLSLQEEYSDQFIGPPPERTLRLPVTDHYAPTLEQLAEGVAFIAAAYADTLPILVHCHAGVGRAPLTAAAYLVQQRAMAPDAALVYLRAARPIVSLNQLQCCRLYEWANYTGANV